ncbi:MAG: HEAT repeat domain-containing protein [Actinobacteria bacterium]|nr:HEAT repeat domain-containing protein [Actinomycetota bacterium]
MPSQRDAGSPQNPPDPASPGTTSAVAARRRAIVLSGHSGDPASARDALDDPEPSLRVAALGALARLARLSASDLHRAMGDPDPGVRRRAAELAATDPTEKLTDGLLGLLADPEPLVAEMAAWSLGERPPSGNVVQALCTMARGHDDPLCRESAVAALGALGDPAGLSAIVEATHDRPAIRRRAVIALAPFEGPEVDAALERARSDRDWQVRQAAEDQEGRAPG